MASRGRAVWIAIAVAGARVQTAFVIGATGRGMHTIGRDVQCCLRWLPRR